MATDSSTIPDTPDALALVRQHAEVQELRTAFDAADLGFKQHIARLEQRIATAAQEHQACILCGSDAFIVLRREGTVVEATAERDAAVRELAALREGFTAAFAAAVGRLALLAQAWQTSHTASARAAIEAAVQHRVALLREAFARERAELDQALKDARTECARAAAERERLAAERAEWRARA
jgi:hypothetical protein